MTIATLKEQPVKARFPLHVVMFGIECVCIPATQYRELTRPSGGKVRLVHRLSRLDKDAEVRAFVEAHLGCEDVRGIRLAAIERFGTDRIPSKSSFHRFVMQLRRQGG